MKPIDYKMRTHFTIQDSKNKGNITKWIKKILDSNYVKANVKKIINDLKYLNNENQSSFLKLSRKYEQIFDGTLGNNTGLE